MLVLAFIHKRMVRTAPGLDVFGRFNKTVAREIDLPIACCRGLSDLLRLFDSLRRTGFLIGKLDEKPFRNAVRCETDKSLVRIAFLEMPDTPRVQREDLFLENPAEFVLPSAFQFNEVLRFLVAVEIRRLI